MRMKLFATLVLLIPSLARAETKMMVTQSLQRIVVDAQPTGLPSKTQYNVLEMKFESAKGLELKDLEGWQSGRCFFKDSPSRPVATLLAVDSSSDSATSGPLFKAISDRHVTPLINTTARADFFDRMDPAQVSKVQRVIAASNELNAFPVRSNEELVITGYRTVDLESRAYRIRKQGAYLFLKLECSERSYCSNSNAWNSNKFLAYEYEPVAYCYYFKKLKP